MTLPAPKLDDRKFQDIVTEARSKIPQYCPKWTDYNLSDPGITVIEMFAWMVDMMLYRMNRVPDKNYIKLMEMIGIRLEPPQPAKVNLTFRLSTPQPEPVTIPHGTEAATVRTETLDAISFTTDRDFTIILPNLTHAFTTADDQTFVDIISPLKNPDRQVSVFQDVPRENNALYLGFEESLASHTLGLTFQSNIEGIGVNPDDPPWSWEYWDGEYERWVPMILESDTTGGLNTNGQVVLHLPASSTIKTINGQDACWIRCRALKPRPGQSGYVSSPKVKSIIAESVGCTVSASQCYKTKGELLGRSKGKSGQLFYLHNPPVLSRQPGETIEVETENEGEYEPWQEVPYFADSLPTDKHFTLDSITGEIQFGPSLKQPSGEERQYGSIPPNERLIRFTSYRTGGGIIGNVGEGTVTELKSSIPYIDTVKNFDRARGGTDAETLERAKLRVPQVLRTNTRAVTGEDFEYLAEQASSKVARAKCITPGETPSTLQPGSVRVLLIPTITERNGYIAPEQLDITSKLREEVTNYLDERRLLGVRLEINKPQYIYVTVEVHVRALRGFDKIATDDIERKLYQYINPICGGLEGNGWQFGRVVNASEIQACLQDIQHIDYIEQVKLFPIDPETGERQDATARVIIPPDGVVCSYKHNVVIIK